MYESQLTAMNTEGIKFETVFEANQHYQKLKSQQEKTLQELRMRRSKLSDELEVTMVERMKAENRRSKTTETLKMVQHRVAQLQAQLNTLRETSERGRKTVERFHRELDKEKAQQLEESSKFEDQLESVCEELKSMWKFFQKDNIQMLIVDNECTTTRLEHKITQMNRKPVELTDRLKQLQSDNDAEARRQDELEIPGDVQCLLVHDQAVTEEAAVDELKSVSRHLEDLQSQLTQMKSAQ